MSGGSESTKVRRPRTSTPFIPAICGTRTLMRFSTAWIAPVWLPTTVVVSGEVSPLRVSSSTAMASAR